MDKTLSAALLVRQARRRANLTQVELARRAGVAQSVVSAYESGQRQPALPTLIRLIEAAGYDVDIVLRPHDDRKHRMRGPLGSKVRAHSAELRRAAEKYGASNLCVFGSVARGEESANSDVDILADLSPQTSLFTLARLQRELETLLDARVDLVPASDLKPGVRADVERDVVPL